MNRYNPGQPTPEITVAFTHQQRQASLDSGPAPSRRSLRPNPANTVPRALAAWRAARLQSSRSAAYGGWYCIQCSSPVTYSTPLDRRSSPATPGRVTPAFVSRCPAVPTSRASCPLQRRDQSRRHGQTGHVGAPLLRSVTTGRQSATTASTPAPIQLSVRPAAVRKVALTSRRRWAASSRLSVSGCGEISATRSSPTPGCRSARSRRAPPPPAPGWDKGVHEGGIARGRPAAQLSQQLPRPHQSVCEHQAVL